MDGARAAFDTAVDPGPEAPRPVYHGPVHHGHGPRSAVAHARRPAHGADSAPTGFSIAHKGLVRLSKEDHPSLKVLNGPGRRAGSHGSCRRTGR